MTDYIVKCADVEWQRHSVSIVIGDFQTKMQRLTGVWNRAQMEAMWVDPATLSGGATTTQDYDIEVYDDFYEQGSNGIWITDDTIHDRITIWRPPYTMDIKRAALLVTSNIDADANEYYNFKLLNSADDTIISYIYTSGTSIVGESPNEMTVVTTSNTVTRSQAIILQIEDELAKAPITDLSVVIDYEPSA